MLSHNQIATIRNFAGIVPYSILPYSTSEDSLGHGRAPLPPSSPIRGSAWALTRARDMQARRNGSGVSLAPWLPVGSHFLALDSQNVARTQNEYLFAVVLDFGATVFAVDDSVTF
jgi:hypothetical protein